MNDSGRELGAIKREVVEARNQAIKTDHQVKNLTLDVKGFEKRFDMLERRTKVASLGVHALVALTIAVAATIVTSVRTRLLQEEIGRRDQQIHAAEEGAERRERELNERLRDLEKEREAQALAQKVTLEILTSLDQNKENVASALLVKLDQSALSGLEQSLAGRRLDDFRKRAAEEALKQGKAHATASRLDQAAEFLARSIELDDAGPTGAKARWMLAKLFVDQEQDDKAEPVLRRLRGETKERTQQEELNFLLGSVLARLGKREEAKSVLRLASSVERYQEPAKLYLAALESGGPLPEQR
jgi:TolA-binding protein